MTAVQALIYAGCLYVMMRYFFPHVFLMPVMVAAGVFYVCWCFARAQVVLDRADGEVAISFGFWISHVRLTQIERVAVFRSGAKIKTAGGVTYGFGPLWKRRWLERLLRVRSGFEGMEVAIPQAAAAARAAHPGRAVAEDAASRRAASRRHILVACFAFAVGPLSLAMAAVVQPQASGWLVHSVAVLLRIYCVTAGAAAMLIGALLVYGPWRDRRTARQHG